MFRRKAKKVILETIAEEPELSSQTRKESKSADSKRSESEKSKSRSESEPKIQPEAQEKNFGLVLYDTIEREFIPAINKIDEKQKSKHTEIASSKSTLRGSCRKLIEDLNKNLNNAEDEKITPRIALEQFIKGIENLIRSWKERGSDMSSPHPMRSFLGSAIYSNNRLFKRQHTNIKLLRGLYDRARSSYLDMVMSAAAKDPTEAKAVLLEFMQAYRNELNTLVGEHRVLPDAKSFLGKTASLVSGAKKNPFEEVRRLFNTTPYGAVLKYYGEIYGVTFENTTSKELAEVRSVTQRRPNQ